MKEYCCRSLIAIEVSYQVVSVVDIKLIYTEKMHNITSVNSVTKREKKAHSDHWRETGLPRLIRAGPADQSHY